MSQLLNSGQTCVRCAVGEFCRPFPDFAVSISLGHLSRGRCDDYRGCSVRKRNDPKPFETVDF